MPAAIALAAGIALLGAGAGLGASPAAAHGGAIELTVASDGAGGVTATPVYVNDGHPVEELIDATVTAKSDAGDRVGPIELASSPEGEGLWVTDEPVLWDGNWKVTVRMTEPERAKTTLRMDVVGSTVVAPGAVAEPGDPDGEEGATDPATDPGDPAGTEPPAATAAPEDAAAGEGTAGDGTAASGIPAVAWIIGGAVLLIALIGAAVLIARRRRTT